MTSKIFLSGILSVAVVALIALFYSTSQPAVGSGYIGWPVHLQTATTTTVGPDTNVTLFADAADCKSRVVSTRGSAIVVSFGDTAGYGSTTMALSDGHLQAASTTVAYESGTYGCGRMTALGYSSTTITTSSF